LRNEDFWLIVTIKESAPHARSPPPVALFPAGFGRSAELGTPRGDFSVAPAGQRVPAKGKERVVAAKFVTATQ